jgi:HlyD family secretion protein
MKINRKVRKYLYWILALVVLIGIIFWLRRDNSEAEYSTAFVIAGPLKQTVAETGTVKALKELKLNFAQSGKVVDILVEVGDEIEKGELLAQLDNTALGIRRLEALAGLQMAQANLSKLLEGASLSAVNVSQSNLEQAQIAQSSAENDLEKVKKSVEQSVSQATKTLADLESSQTITPLRQAVNSAQINLENVKTSSLKNIAYSRSLALNSFKDKLLVAQIAIDNVYALIEDDQAKNVLSAKDSAWLIKVKNGRLISLKSLDEANLSLEQALDSASDDLTNAAGELTQKTLSQVRELLSNTYFMLEATITSSSFPQSSLDSYKSIINGQISQISSAITSVENSLYNFQTANLQYETSVSNASEGLRQAEANLDNAILNAQNNLNSLILSKEQQISLAEAKLNSAKQSVVIAQAQLDNIKDEASNSDINLAQAQISQAQANINSIDEQIENTKLYSPFTGILTELNYNIGEQFSPSLTNFAALLVDDLFEIEVDIAESDINKVKINDQVKITLDAFSRDTIFNGFVSFIEPAQTIIQGVVYYKVKIQFTSLDNWLADNIEKRQEIKAGMTANVEIETASRENVLQVPGRAIINQEDKNIVRVLKDEELVEKEVQTGLRGDSGLVEIISGLSEGEEIITFIRNSN